jgi:hypothetical protein
MNFKSWSRFSVFFSLLCLLLGLGSCADTLESSELVYSNDFSKLDLKNFENGKLFVFQEDTVAGFYHNEEVAVTLEELPPHNLLKITIDILIHDSWDGNPNDSIGGPDFWFFGIDNKEIFRTTFSNSPCVSTYCLYQSYPNAYFRQNTPKSGATQINQPGLCLFGAFPNYTTRYSISKIVEHLNSKVRIYMNTELVSTNSPFPVCDESWSLAGVTVEALTLN